MVTGRLAFWEPRLTHCWLLPPYDRVLWAHATKLNFKKKENWGVETDENGCFTRADSAVTAPHCTFIRGPRRSFPTSVAVATSSPAA